MRRCTTILLMCVAFLSACSTPRKACRKADRLIARAVWKCPEVLKHDSATAVIPPSSAILAPEPATIDLDSLLTACAALNAALMAEQAAAPRPKFVPAGTKPNTSLGVHTAVRAIQSAASPWDSFTQQVGRITVTVKNFHGTPLISVEDPGTTVRVPCPPVVSRVEVKGVATWYRTFTWAVLGWIALCIVFFLSIAVRHHAGP